MKVFLKQRIPYVILFIVVVALVIVSLINYSFQLNKTIDGQTELYLTETAGQAATLFDTEMAGNIDTLTPIARYVSTFDDIVSPDVMQNLQSSLDGSYIRRIAVITPDGNMHLPGVRTDANISSRSYFQQNMQGNNAISDVLVSEFSSDEVIITSVPIWKNGAVVGVLAASYETGDLETLLEITSFRGEGDTYIVDRHGNLVIGYASSNALFKTGNIFNADDNPVAAELRDIPKIRKDMAEGRTGFVSYSFEGQPRYMGYAPTTTNGWYVFSAVPAYIANTQYEAAITLAIWLAVEIIAGFVICVAAIIFLAVRGKRAVEKSHEQTRINEERYKMLTELSSDIVFEWTAADGRFFFSNNWYTTFGLPVEHPGEMDYILQTGIVYPDDTDALREYFKRLMAGDSPPALECRARTRSGEYVWLHIRSTAISDDTGKVARILGAMTDVTKEHHEKQQLILKSQTDSLTRLLNKGAAEQLADDYMADASGDELAAFLILDVDKFKSVNDQYGHPFGDIVLKRLAAHMKHTFRSTDVLTRMGGDEFAVLMKDIPDEEFAMQRVQDLRNRFGAETFDEEPDASVSCSIGIAYFPKNGGTFAQLYKNADSALYAAKENGRNALAVFAEKSP